MPWLYHKYAGHDLNRDAFMMNMAENRNLARFFYTQWHPQVFLTMHQMGHERSALLRAAQRRPDRSQLRSAASGARRGCSGSAMALELQRDGTSGVVSNAMYDYYWPGYEDSAPLGHNVVCLLTEVASRQGRDAGDRARPRTCAPASRGCRTTGRRSTSPIPGRAGTGRSATSSSTT